MKLVGKAVRILLSAGLLVIVWRNSHWSVALTITLMGINAEIAEVLRERAEVKRKIGALLAGIRYGVRLPGGSEGQEKKFRN